MATDCTGVCLVGAETMGQNTYASHSNQICICKHLEKSKHESKRLSLHALHI